VSKKLISKRRQMMTIKTKSEKNFQSFFITLIKKI